MRPTRSTRYIDRPHSWRRDRYVGLRWKIHQDPDGRGVFYSRMLMPGMLDWHKHADMLGPDALPQGHARIHFLSQMRPREGWLYHAQFRSAAHARMEAIELQMEDEVETLLAPYGGTIAGYADRHWWRRKGNPLARVTPWPRFEALGGKTLPEIQWEVGLSILSQEGPAVALGVSRSFACPSGIDLDFIVPEPELTVDVVIEHIKKFWETSENNLTTIPVEDWSPYASLFSTYREQQLGRLTRSALASREE